MNTGVTTRLAQLRAAALAMLDGLSPAQQRWQSHPELSPMLWHVGHVFFVENHWLAERVFGDTRVTDPWRELYFPEQCPKGERSGRLPDAEALRDWSAQVSYINDRYWQQVSAVSHPLLAGGYLRAFIGQHYAQHLETMRLAAIQLRNAESEPRPSDIEPRPPRQAATTLPRHRIRLGTDNVDAYDNEQPSWEAEIEPFAIASHPVTNAEWLGFMAADGYARRELWDAAGWAWRKTGNITHPQHWRPLPDGRWHISGADAAPIGEQAVHCIGWYEARAYARYAGARLPHETEWEAADRAGLLNGRNEVWEWCDNAFYPYSGFRAFPYDGYSLPWFDGRHFVARGASRLSEIEIRRPGFRNFYPPTHRHILAGLRLAA